MAPRVPKAKLTKSQGLSASGEIPFATRPVNSGIASIA